MPENATVAPVILTWCTRRTYRDSVGLNALADTVGRTAQQLLAHPGTPEAMVGTRTARLRERHSIDTRSDGGPPAVETTDTARAARQPSLADLVAHAQQAAHVEAGTGPPTNIGHARAALLAEHRREEGIADAH